MYEQTSMIGPQTAEAPAPAARYYEINEETARNAHYCVHMSDYKPGSATATIMAIMWPSLLATRGTTARTLGRSSYMTRL